MALGVGFWGSRFGFWLMGLGFRVFGLAFSVGFGGFRFRVWSLDSPSEHIVGGSARHRLGRPPSASWTPRTPQWHDASEFLGLSFERNLV